MPSHVIAIKRLLKRADSSGNGSPSGFAVLWRTRSGERGSMTVPNHANTAPSDLRKFFLVDATSRRLGTVRRFDGWSLRVGAASCAIQRVTCNDAMPDGRYRRSIGAIIDVISGPSPDLVPIAVSADPAPPDGFPTQFRHERCNSAARLRTAPSLRHFQEVQHGLRSDALYAVAPNPSLQSGQPRAPSRPFSRGFDRGTLSGR